MTNPERHLHMAFVRVVYARDSIKKAISDLATYEFPSDTGMLSAVASILETAEKNLSKLVHERTVLSEREKQK